MLFNRRLREGIADGSVTLIFRRWRRPQAVAGHRYRTGGPLIEVTSVRVVQPAEVTAGDARRAGYHATADLLGDLRGSPAAPLYRIAFRRIEEPDPREVLARDTDLTGGDTAQLRRRLDRLDRASRHGAWTGATLAAIAARPGVRAAQLAADLGRETMPFKADVRKLKALGLTESMPVGYRLSPRGAAYLAQTQPPG